MFIDNKYTKCYYKIIAKALSRNSTAGYTETHHIIPKSLGGSNLSENLVILTAKEHFICHLLLTKMTYGKCKRNMHFAFWMLSNKTKHTNSTDAYNFVVHSRLYQQARENFTTEMSVLHKGKVLSAETKNKISVAHEGKTLSEKHKAKINPNGRILSQETKDKISNSQTGRIGGMQNKQHSHETKDKISASNKGKTKKPLSKERKDQISKQFTGTIQTDEHISKRITARATNGHYNDRDATIEKMKNAAQARPKYECQCGKSVSPSNFKRWHGENCKKLRNPIC